MKSDEYSVLGLLWPVTGIIESVLGSCVSRNRASADQSSIQCLSLSPYIGCGCWLPISIFCTRNGGSDPPLGSKIEGNVARVWWPNGVRLPARVSRERSRQVYEPQTAGSMLVERI